MQSPGTKIQRRNQGSGSNKKESEDIHFLTKTLPRQIVFLDLDFKNDYDSMILFAEYLLRFYEANLPKELEDLSFNKNDTLVYGVKELIGNLTPIIIHYGDFISRKTLYFYEPIDSLCQSLFYFEMSFVDLNIPDNIKIGIAQVYYKIFSFFDVSLNDLNKESLTNELYFFNIDFVEEDEEFDYRDYDEYLNKAFEEIEKYNELLKGNFYLDNQYEDFKDLHSIIKNLLDFDMGNISSLSFSDIVFNEDEISLAESFVPLFNRGSKTSDLIENHYTHNISESGGNAGQERLYAKWTMNKNSLRLVNKTKIKKIESFEKNLCDFLQNIYKLLE